MVNFKKIGIFTIFFMIGTSFYCAKQYIHKDVVGPYESPEVDLLNIWLQRNANTAENYYKKIFKAVKAEYQLVKLSSNRLEISIDSLSLVQGDGNQDLILNQDTSFKSIEEGSIYELLEMENLPDGNYTHLKFVVAALKLYLPAHIVIKELDNPTQTECATNNLNLTYYLNDSFLNDEIKRGDLQIVFECAGEIWEFWSESPDFLFESQLETPNSTFTNEFDRPIRVTDKKFGKHLFTLLMDVESSLSFKDYNFNQSLDLGLDETETHMELSFREKLEFFPWYDIRLVSKNPDDIIETEEEEQPDSAINRDSQPDKDKFGEN